MIAPDLITEAVAAVRTAALFDEAPDYWRLAHEVVTHRVRHSLTYGWPAIGALTALHAVFDVAERARREDGCRCGSTCCDHGDDMGAEPTGATC